MAAQCGERQGIGLEPGAGGRIRTGEGEHDGRQRSGGRHVGRSGSERVAIVLATALFAR
jgi:hypothetical protein